jgi:hypothetical protein
MKPTFRIVTERRACSPSILSLYPWLRPMRCSPDDCGNKFRHLRQTGVHKTGRQQRSNHTRNVFTALIAGVAGYLIAPPAALWLIALLGAASAHAVLASVRARLIIRWRVAWTTTIAATSIENARAH